MYGEPYPMRLFVKAIFSLLLFLFGGLYSISGTAEDAGSPLLTEDEKEWVRNHPVIRVANEFDWPPFDFNEGGEARGMVVDHMRLLAKKTGLKIEFVHGYQWKTLISMFKRKEIDVLPVLYKNEERKQYTLFTDPYYKGRLGIFVNNNDTTLNVGLLNQKVGMESAHGSIPLIRKKFPGIDLVEVDTKIELVQRVATGKLDSMIGNPFVFYYLAREYQIDNLRLVDFVGLTEAEQSDTSLHIGVRKDWPMLHGILQKAMDDVSDDEMAVIRNKWADVTIVEQVNWWYMIQFIGVVLIILLFLSWHNIRLKKTVLEKTRELKSLNKSLEFKVEQRTEALVELNKELECLAHTDPMTQVYNRRYFFEVANKAMAFAKRQGSGLSLLMIDIDRFKKINDHYGHDAGDAVCKFFCSTVEKNLRGSDILARFGGDEFVVIFPATKREGAISKADKIRGLIESSVVEPEIAFTISVGVSELLDADDTVESLLLRADKALYKAKECGRNRVEYL